MQNLDRDRVRAVRRPQNNVYVSRTASAGGRTAGDSWNTRLLELSASGRLAEVVAAVGESERAALTGAAYHVAWPVVFTRLTRRIELNRGHVVCAAGVERLADECLDRFHDDVEAVVDDLLTHARTPIQNLSGWIAGRLTAATVDGHRRRRGLRGALQRPRIPGWLAEDLGRDEWLMTLATQMLVWVGVSGTAGSEVWPLEAWAHKRAARTGDWQGSNPVRVSIEVETVLGIMRRRPQWYEQYVERPLGRKQAAVAALPVGDGSSTTAAPLALGDPDGVVEAEMSRLAADAVGAIRRRLENGERTRVVVAEVIRAVFGGPFTPTIDKEPHRAVDPLGGVTGALSDPARLDRIVSTVREIIGERDG